VRLPTRRCCRHYVVCERILLGEFFFRVRATLDKRRSKALGLLSFYMRRRQAKMHLSSSTRHIVMLKFTPTLHRRNIINKTPRGEYARIQQRKIHILPIPWIFKFSWPFVCSFGFDFDASWNKSLFEKSGGFASVQPLFMYFWK